MAASSAITGLILPGMIDEPGCSAGRLISASPVLGPDDSRRKSLEMRMTSSARLRSAETDRRHGQVRLHGIAHVVHRQ